MDLQCFQSSAANNDFVTVVVDPADYGRVLDEDAFPMTITTSQGLLANACFTSIKTTAAYTMAPQLNRIPFWYGLNQSKVNSQRLLLVKGNKKEQDLRFWRKSSAVPQRFYKMPGAPAHSLLKRPALRDAHLTTIY